jgi:hypothetical protein
MRFTLETTGAESYVSVRATGERTYEATAALAGAVMEACRQHGLRKALVDVTGLTGKLSVLNIIQLVVTRFSELKDKKMLNKTAIVDRSENRNHYTLLETAADNRGYNLRVFESSEDAIAWLKAE